jgi:hypothetical protein
MWYDRGYANSSLYPPVDRRRTPPHPDGTAFERWLRVASLPDITGIRSRRTSSRHSSPVGLPPADGPQRHPRFQYPWTRHLARALIAPPSAANNLPRRGVRGAARSLTLQSPRLWPRYQRVDVAAGRSDQFRAGTDSQARLRRECASRAQALANHLETRQTLDHQSRSAIPAKKNARDRLIAWCSQQPDWAIGFLDEVWWSRFALPRLHAGQTKEQPMHLVEQTWHKGDPRSQSPGELRCLVAERVARRPRPF